MQECRKRAYRFNANLQRNYLLLNIVHTHDNKVKCEHLETEFYVAVGGHSHINDHLKSNRHKISLLSARYTKAIECFKSNNPVGKEY